MNGARSSRIALVLDGPVEDVGALVAQVRTEGGIDRASAHVGDGTDAQDVHWGGRMQRAVIRRVEEDGRWTLHTEVMIAGDGLVDGLSRQAALLAALARTLAGRVRGVHDLSARVERDLVWLTRVAAGVVDPTDAVVVEVGADPSEPRGGGRGPVGWVLTHGAARLGVPDLELYGVPTGSIASACAVLERVGGQLATEGLGAPLSLADGTLVRLVPVLEVWSALPASWPGPGRAGVDRGPGLDGPRATLSVLHRARFGRHRLDLEGIRDRLGPDSAPE
jgi:hypothetical protein